MIVFRTPSRTRGLRLCQLWDCLKATQDSKFAVHSAEDIYRLLTWKIDMDLARSPRGVASEARSLDLANQT